MTTVVSHAPSELAGLVGEGQVATDDESRRKYAVDGMPPQMVVYPRSAEEVAGVLKHAADRGLTAIACRNGTKLGVGNPPQRYDIALCLKSMTSVWYYEPADLVVSAEAGMKLGDFQHFVGRDGLWLPLDPPGGAQASLGGILAGNAAGPLRMFYGSPRDMVLGMKIATTEGKVIKTGGRVVKNVAGFDIGKLLIGSCGTLGVIVEATLKLYPRPAMRESYVLRVKTLAAARNVHQSILNSPLQPLRMVLLNTDSARLAGRDAGAGGQANSNEMWIETGGSAAVIGRARSELEQIARATACGLAELEPSAAMAGWERITNFAALFAEAEPRAIVLKAALPISAIEGFFSRAEQFAESEKIKIAAVGECGAGIVRLALFQVAQARSAAETVLRLRQAAADFGGTLMVERAPAESKGQLDVWGPVGDDFEVMKRVKEVWDPKHILSPGRFLGGL